MEHTPEAGEPQESNLDQFGLGPEDDAHADEGKPRKLVQDEPGGSSVNTFGLGPEDLEGTGKA